jgi:hypothetical protein
MVDEIVVPLTKNNAGGGVATVHIIFGGIKEPRNGER